MYTSYINNIHLEGNDYNSASRKTLFRECKSSWNLTTWINMGWRSRDIFRIQCRYLYDWGPGPKEKWGYTKLDKAHSYVYVQILIQKLGQKCETSVAEIWILGLKASPRSWTHNRNFLAKLLIVLLCLVKVFFN